MGATNSRDFPTTSGAFQKALSGDYDGFITAFSQIFGSDTGPALAVAYSTYLGGPGTDIAYTVATGHSQAVYVGGYTSSSTFLPPGRPQPVAAKSTFLIQLSFAGETTIPAIPTALYLTAQDWILAHPSLKLRMVRCPV